MSRDSEPKTGLRRYLERVADTLPEKEAVVTQEGRVTYGQLEKDGNAVANWLKQGGVRNGDRVFVFGSNSAQAVAAFWGVQKAGGVVSVIHPQTKGSKLAFLLGDSSPKALVMESHLFPVLAGPLAEASADLQVLAWGKREVPPTVKNHLIIEWWDSVVTEGDGTGRPGRESNPSDLAAIIYTSGSTGEPKGVMLTQRNMLAAAESVGTYLEMREDDILLSVLPLSFDYGLYQVILAARTGATVVLEKSFAFPARTLGIIERERVTGFPGIPTIFSMMARMENLHEFDLSRVRFVTSTAATLNESNIDFLKGAFPAARIFSMYGVTECHRVSYLPVEDLDQKPRSVGIPIPNTDFWIVDDSGNTLGPGQVGQLVVRGDTVMAGYWGDFEATAAKLRPGPEPGTHLLFTGDLGWLDEDGYLYFRGRMDDIIKSRGEKVSPKEVEDVLCRIEGISEAAVVGVPDPILGSALRGFAVVDPGADLTEAQVLRECRAMLEAFMVPERVILSSELPKSAHGKVDKNALLHSLYESDTE